jgi:hypothetical protein
MSPSHGSVYPHHRQGKKNARAVLHTDYKTGATGKYTENQGGEKSLISAARDTEIEQSYRVTIQSTIKN